MKSNRRNIVIIAAFAGLTAGFIIRGVQHGAPVDNAAGASPRSAEDASGGKNGRPEGQKPDATPLTARLEEDLAVSAGVSRWLEWMAALERASLSDFPGLARIARNDPVALRMISARWLELNPAHLLETLIATGSGDGPGGSFPSDELCRQLFDELTRRDPASAIAAINRPDFPPEFRDLRVTVLNEVMKKDPELGLKTLHEWGVENFGVDTERIASWAEADPKHAAEFALAHPAGYTTHTALEAIGRTWAKSDPEGALNFSSGLKSRFGAALATGIVSAWAGNDLRRTADWLAAADPAVRNRLNGPMVEIWARTDSAGAMEWVQQYLSGRSQDEAVGALLKGVAEKNVAAAAEMVSGMDATDARAKAAVSVARKWLPGFDSGKSATPEAIAWLSTLDPLSIRQVIDQMQWQWAGSDAAGFSAFLATQAGQAAPEHAYSSAARELARTNPQQALDWAERLPAERRAEAALQVFNEWQTAQPAAAMEWLKKLPAADPRRDSFYLAAVRNYLPGGGEEASRAAKALSASSPAQARAVVQKLPIPDDLKVQLMQRLDLK